MQFCVHVVENNVPGKRNVPNAEQFKYMWKNVDDHSTAVEDGGMIYPSTMFLMSKDV
jgi:hypothetical protein